MECKKHGTKYLKTYPGHPGKLKCGKCSESDKKRLRELMDKICNESPKNIPNPFNQE